jgi:hypothetical protein
MGRFETPKVDNQDGVGPKVAKHFCQHGQSSLEGSGKSVLVSVSIKFSIFPRGHGLSFALLLLLLFLGSQTLQSCPPVMSGSHARQSCPAVMPGSHARQSCPAVMPGSHARQSCPAVMPGSHARHKYYKFNNRPARPAELQAFLRP